MTSSGTTPASILAHYRGQFPVFRNAIYLNSCSLGPLSLRARAMTLQYLDEWDARGASAWYDTWLPALDRLREGYAEVIGARAPEVALHPSISSALTAVAESLDYAARPKVVTTSLDFPTVAYQWLAKAGRGVEVTIVPSRDGTSIPIEEFARAIDARTALVATSHVFFTTGAIQDLAALSDRCRHAGTLLFVDGYQGAGQVAVDVRASGVDFYAAGGLKWLLGGSGIAFLYSNPATTSHLAPRTAGWFGHRAPFDFDIESLELRADGRRFEAGTPSVAAIYAQLAGLDRVQAATRDLAADLVDRAQRRGLAPRVAADPARRSAIVTIPRPDPGADVRALADAGIIADARPGLVRLSPYFYNTPGDHAAALEVLTHG
jgi:kynureninase